MKRSELKELHFITRIDSLASILELGILSNKLAQKVKHASIADSEIQGRRSTVVVPGGRQLHEYTNLYICGRNPMLRKRRHQHAEICVLRVSTDVLDLAGVVIADANASSDYVRFAAAPNGLQIVDRELTFAEYWTDADERTYWKKKSAKCAEVLVPDCIDPKYILGCYVSCEESRKSVNELVPELNAAVDAHLFFL